MGFGDYRWFLMVIYGLYSSFLVSHGLQRSKTFFKSLKIPKCKFYEEIEILFGKWRDNEAGRFGPKTFFCLSLLVGDFVGLMLLVLDFSQQLSCSLAGG